MRGVGGGVGVWGGCSGGGWGWLCCFLGKTPWFWGVLRGLSGGFLRLFILFACCCFGEEAEIEEEWGWEWDGGKRRTDASVVSGCGVRLSRCVGVAVCGSVTWSAIRTLDE